MLQKIVAGVTLLFFAAIALVVLIGSFEVLFTAPPSTTTAEVPPPPDLPPLPVLSTDTAAAAQQVSLYQHETTAYTQRVAAWDEYLKERAARDPRYPDRMARYQAVVKDALVPLLTPIVAAFLAYAFVKGATNIVQNIMAARTPAAPLKDLQL